MDSKTSALIRLVEEEMDKVAWIDRAARVLRRRGLIGEREGVRMKVRVELDVELQEGHPVRMLALLSDSLQQMTFETEGVQVNIAAVTKIEIV